MTGIEVAAADAKTLYVSLTQFEGRNSHPYLVRSHDRGATWNMVALEPSIGMQLPRILGIDKDDAKRVYLRLGSTQKDHSACTTTTAARSKSRSRRRAR